MTRPILARYWDVLPEDVKKRILTELTPSASYAARANDFRERLIQQFPNMNPKLRAVISLAAARLL